MTASLERPDAALRPLGDRVPPTRRRRRLSGRTWFTVATSALLVYLIGGPLVMLLYSSLKRTEGSLPFEATSPWSLTNYADVFLSSGTYSVLWNTLVFAAGSLTFSFAIAIALAWLVERTDLPLRNGVFTLVIASLGIPSVISGISWTWLLSPRNGLVNVALRALLGMEGEGPLDVFTMAGMVFVQAITLVPVTFLLITASFRAMDSVLEEAGETSGARFRTVVRRITLPVLAPALVGAGVYQLVTVIESFDIPLVIGLRAGIPVLSTQIFLQVRPSAGLPDFGVASTYSVLLLLLALGPLLYYNWIIARAERFTTISGKDYRQRRYELGGAKPLALVGVGLYLAISFLLPVLALVWASVQPYFSLPSPSALERSTLAAYRSLPQSASFTDALVNTLILGGVTAVVTLLIGLATAWVIVRVRSRWSRALDVLAFLPHAFPGVIIGLSILLIYLVLPIPILGTIWVIVLALSTQFTSLSTRLMGSSIAQIQPQLEEAAEVSGARWRHVLRRILLPLVLPPFINGMLLVFLLSIKNLTLALVLYAPDSVVLSTLIWTRWDAGQTAETAAIGTVMVLITLVLSVALRRFQGIGQVR